LYTANGASDVALISDWCHD